MIVKEKMIFDLKCLNFFFVVKIEWNSLDLFVGIVSLCSGLRETDSSKRTFSDIYRSKESTEREREREGLLWVGDWKPDWNVLTQRKRIHLLLFQLSFLLLSLVVVDVSTYISFARVRAARATRGERERVWEREREREWERERVERFSNVSQIQHTKD